MHLKWIVGDYCYWISGCVMGCRSINTDKKDSLSYVVKAWWTLVWHQLSPTIGDNITSPDKASLVDDIMKDYEIDLSKILAREIHD